jgi:hypothetical protein
MQGNKTCVIFAVSIFSKDRVYVLEEFLQHFKRNFQDAVFFVGINYGCLSEIEEILTNSGLNYKIRRLSNADLYSGSDASAYQIALELCSEESVDYDTYWFVHTKGAVNNRDFERNKYLSEMIDCRESIEFFLYNQKEIGSYGLRGVSRSAALHDWRTFNVDVSIPICSNENFESFVYSHVNWSYIETIFIMNKQSVEFFLSKVKVPQSNFFKEKLHACYFEIVFPWIASRMGFFPYIKERECFWREQDLKQLTFNWMVENNLLHLKHLLEL